MNYNVIATFLSSKRWLLVYKVSFNFRRLNEQITKHLVLTFGYITISVNFYVL